MSLLSQAIYSQMTAPSPPPGSTVACTKPNAPRPKRLRRSGTKDDGDTGSKDRDDDDKRDLRELWQRRAPTGPLWPEAHTTAIRHATLLTVTDGTISQGTILINPNRKIFEARKRETAALGAGEKLVLGHPLAATIGDSARCMQNLEKVLFTGPKTSDTVTFICD